MAGQPAVADLNFAFVPHSCKPLTGGPVAVDAASMNPGFLTSTGVKRHDPLQKIVNRRVLEEGVTTPKHPELRQLRFALVDLTGSAKLKDPQFAGHNETDQGGLGSLAKTACMYAAFQLKFDLEELARQKSLTSEKALFDAARDVWNDTQKRDTTKTTLIFPKGPKIEMLGKLIEIDSKKVPLPRGLSAPDLERIFTVTSGGSGGVSVRFKGSDLILVDPAVPGTKPPHITKAVQDYAKAGGESLKSVRKLTFAERLFLMIDESDNAATHSCIENVSFLYIASSLWQSDIYRPERGGGLWEASTHDTGGVRWILPPVPRGKKGTDFVSATAASVASLFTLMEQGRLVNSDACAAMKQLTSKQKSFPGGSLTRSFFEEGLHTLGFDRLHSKLGIGSFNNDGGIIERTISPVPGDPTKNKQIRYVAAGFDEPLAQNGAQLQELIRQLDKCIQENNGLITAATP
jgi:hypothetical protein